jgi:hypothetical protein
MSLAGIHTRSGTLVARPRQDVPFFEAAGLYQNFSVMRLQISWQGNRILLSKQSDIWAIFQQTDYSAQIWLSIFGQ